MKKTNPIIAIIALAIVATAVAFVSCKKETEKALSQKDYTIQQTADVRQIEDITSYLKDFKKKMTESKGDEAYNLEDAAWHLASLANFDFCKVNVEYNDFQFDTVEMQVNILDGVVLLGDLNMAYEQMCTEIQQFKKGFTHNNQNLYYINVSITAEGNARIALMTSFSTASKDLEDHTWYFDDYYVAYLECYDYFSDDSTYVWNTTAKRELQRILNLTENHEGVVIDSLGTTQTYYIPTRHHTFSYNNSQDPYGSPFIVDSRTYAATGDTYSSPNLILSNDEMCYCLDSYLGLGYDYIDDNLFTNEHPVCWTVIPKSRKPINYKWWIYYHQLYVEYGCLASIPNPYD